MTTSNRRFYVTGFVILVAFDTAIQIALKIATRATGAFAFNAAWLRAALASPWVYVAIVGYLVTFFTWMTILERAPVGPAFAASHLQVVTVLAASLLFFHEQLQPRQIVGAACIVAGIAMFAFTQSRRAAHD